LIGVAGYYFLAYSYYGGWRVPTLRFLYQMRYTVGLYDDAVRSAVAERVSDCYAAPQEKPRTRFLRNHHQWLKKFGRDKVHDQIERVITIMKLCNNMNDFREKFARVFKKSPAQLSLFDFDLSR
jgi:hypothetical protein